MLEGSDDGNNWKNVDAALVVETDTDVTTPRYLFAHDTSVIVTYGYLRLRFVLTASSGNDATALVSAAIRLFRAT